jgi:uncharacterized phage protein (TIGR02220 family)
MKQLKKLQTWISAYEKANEIFPDSKAIKDKIELLLKEENISSEIDFDKLIIYYNKIILKSCRVISKKAKDSFKQRIKEGYKKEDIVKVIDNASNDNFHKESNFKHVTLEFLSRSQIFERYSSMEHKKPISQIKDVFNNQ